MITSEPHLRSFNGKRALITGGAGFIGSNLARRLLDLEAEVTIIDSLVPEYGGNLFNLRDIEDRVRLNISDVRDEFSLAYLVQGADFVFNLAGQTSHLDSMNDPYTDLAINCLAQLHILEACRRHSPETAVVFASTRQFYGRPNYLPVDEDHPLHPVDVNGVNKMAGEAYHSLYSEVYGLRTVSLRLTNTYGPRMRVKDARQTFLGIWIRLALEGKPLEVWEGGQLRDFTYVDDAVDALLRAAAGATAPGSVYNLGGSDPPITLSDLAEMLIEVNGCGDYRVQPYPEDRKPIDIGNYYADYGAITRELGWRPTTSLRDGLQRTLEFFRENLGAYV